MDTNEEAHNEEVAGNQEDTDIRPRLTVTHYQQVAADVARGLEELRVVISSLGDPTQKLDRRRGMRGVSLEFIVKAITMVEASPYLRATGRLDPEAAREMLQILEAFAPIRDQARALAYELGVVMESRKSAIAGRALQIYAIAKGFERDESDAGLSVHIGDLRKQVRDRRRKGRARAKAAAEAAATLVPDPQP
jgi:hypothetical protein